ncbi:hypothetical protein MAR_038039 [Mya arenaria]|uniref:NadR/Ttd14 AAA domain-containing protein n=1 Tax=Mya arenaria TaxID=6604 RepID=A0ABY7FQ69_MYAAR|nr:uncharacterized protein LOC128214639 [Mya arenaria]WAR24370.1 hypothetical protein MAR_038039 [Mya arenaria]
MEPNDTNEDIVRIYLCGPHSTGKTTLMLDLEPHLPGVKVVEEVARSVIRNHGWKRDDFRPDKHPDVFRQLNFEILEAQIEVEKRFSEMNQDFICDRAIDPIVYCKFYVGPEARDRMFETPNIQQWIKRLQNSLIILVAPHKEIITEDSVRLASSFEELCQFYESFANELNVNEIPYIELHELDRQKRIDIVLKELVEFKEKRRHGFNEVSVECNAGKESECN